MRGVLTAKISKGGKQGGRREDVVAAVCHCIASLAASLGSYLETDLSMAPTKAGEGPSLVDLLLEQPLSRPLLAALQAIAGNVPSLAGGIRRRALDIIAVILSDRPYRHPGAPPLAPDDLPKVAAEPMPAKAPQRRMSTKPGEDTGAAAQESRLPDVLLALQALQSMGFSCHLLTNFAADSIVPLLKSEDSAIRQAAAVACAHVVVPVPLPGRPPPSTADLVDPAAVAEVLSAVLDAAICDRKTAVRRAILHSLSEHLDPYLAKMSLMQRLCACMHDSDFEVCQMAVATLCRLTKRNPAYALPSMRRYLVSLLAGLDFQSLVTSEVPCRRTRSLPASSIRTHMDTLSAR